MRVLWFTSVMPAAVSTHLGTTVSVGPASWVESLRHTLAGRDDLDLAIASPSPAHYVPFTADRVSYYGIPTQESRTRMGRAVSGWRGSFSLPDMNQTCLEIVRDFDPDVVHIHGTENPFGLIGPHSGAPVVISLQGLLTVYERFFFRGMTSREIAGLALKRDFVLGRGDIHGYWRCVNMAVREREIMRTNGAFMGRTKWDRDVLWAINPGATYYHCDEVLRPPFYEAVWKPETAAPRTVFCTSNTLTWKGAECLIEALGLLRGAGYADVRLRIAGIPPEGPGNEFYAARARKHGVMESIDWLGRLDAGQLVAELLSAALFAYPSHIDNSPNALCEALLVGIPTVASYVGGVPSLIDDGREGLLYPDGDRVRVGREDPLSARQPLLRSRVRTEGAGTGSAPTRSRLDRRAPAGNLWRACVMTRVCIVKQHTTYDLFTRTGPDLRAIVASSNWRSGPIGLWQAFDTSARIVLEDPAPECQLGKQQWSQWVQGWDLWPSGSTADVAEAVDWAPVRHRHLNRRCGTHPHHQALSAGHVVLHLHRRGAHRHRRAVPRQPVLRVQRVPQPSLGEKPNAGVTQLTSDEEEQACRS